MANLSKNSIKRTLYVISQETDKLPKDLRAQQSKYISEQTEKLIKIKGFRRCFGMEGTRHNGSSYLVSQRKYPKVVHKIIDIRNVLWNT